MVLMLMVVVVVGKIQRRIHRRSKHGRRRRHELGRRHGMEVWIIAGHHAATSACSPAAVMVAAHGGHRKRLSAVASPRRVQAQRRWKEFAEGLMVVVVPFLLGLGRELTVSRLDVFFFEGRWPGDVVQLVVEAAGVADRLAVGVATPQRGGVCATVCTACAFPLGRGLNKRKKRLNIWTPKIIHENVFTFRVMKWDK